MYLCGTIQALASPTTLGLQDPGSADATSAANFVHERFLRVIGQTLCTSVSVRCCEVVAGRYAVTAMR